MQNCAKNSYFVKLQGGAVNHNPRKIPMEDSSIIILENNSKCLLLTDKQMPHENCSDCQTKYKTKRMNTRESKERKFETKVRKIGELF